VRELVIDRKRWLRGEDEDSRLLRPSDKKMCCLGFYLCDLGVSADDVSGLHAPCEVGTLPSEGAWLLDVTNPRHNGHDCVELMETNDTEAIKESYREKKIASIFAKHDVKVTFK
jgi:hypothetical protein